MEMPVIPVFRSGKWIQYSMPLPKDPMWNKKHVMRAASFYATACEQGYSQKEAEILAELFINKEVYEGLVYDKRNEAKLKQIMDRVETA
jgi:hypothetical protein